MQHIMTINDLGKTDTLKGGYMTGYGVWRRSGGMERNTDERKDEE
jgi:hypothetical protein